MGSFGSGGLSPQRIESAILKIKNALKFKEPFIFNLLHNPMEPVIERKTVDLYIKHDNRLNLFMHRTKMKIIGYALYCKGNLPTSNS